MMYSDHLSSNEVEFLYKNKHKGTDSFESVEALRFVRDLYEKVESDLHNVLLQRSVDRTFIDQRMKACSTLNDTLKNGNATIFGQRDAEGRVVVGYNSSSCVSQQKVAPLPDFLQGEHVTLFGLSDTQSACDESMKCFERKLPDEPAVVDEILRSNPSLIPRWGVDAEDSQTPLHSTLVSSNVNLAKCYDLTSPSTRLAQPFKRLPGLALPCTFAFYNEATPYPLHLYDFGLHMYHHYKNPKSLVFYVPKLENEEEAAYVRKLISTAEGMIQAVYPSYVLGTVRVLVVLENARAIFRVGEIMDNLYPYFAGASLGWHDYLASTARLYQENGQEYRIPVKADSTIIINHIKTSHELVAKLVTSRGGIAIGGMYGVLPTESPGAMDVALRGFVLDVVIQLRRGLRGFWVARADFVRTGLALVETFLRQPARLPELVMALLPQKFHNEVLSFISSSSQDPGVGVTSPEALIVANLKQSNVIANNDPNEIAYNVFQSLQYITEWLRGNGCVALPATILDTNVLVLDDLATVERSRWEVWHEIHYNRFPLESLIQIVHRELNLIRRDKKPNVHVKYDPKWSPIAMEIFLKLTTDRKPVQFVTELLLPFTSDAIRESASPLEVLKSINPAKYDFQDPYVKRFTYYFERCGSLKFARQMASKFAFDMVQCEHIILDQFDLGDIIEAASFHGDIGQSPKTLDKMAESEQARVVSTGNEQVLTELRELGQVYLNKFHGMKFLVSAKNKSAQFLLDLLKQRLHNPLEEEMENAKKALLEITVKRIREAPLDTILETIKQLQNKHDVVGASICVSSNNNTQNICLGMSNVKTGTPVTDSCLFEIASLSKTIAAACAIEYFVEQNDIPLDSVVNTLLERCNSDYRLRNPQWGNEVLLKHLISHAGLNMHYVNGVPLSHDMPNARDFLDGNVKYGYPAVDVISKPGTKFQYSGAGFLLLEHLLEKFQQRPIEEIMNEYLFNLNLSGGLTFSHKPPQSQQVAHGYDDNGQEIVDSRKMFPALAAGALGTSAGMIKFLERLTESYHEVDHLERLSHDTAARMLHGTDKGCREFMGCLMGLGVFIAECGANRFAVHQGANDGYRGVYLYCFDGPDQGSGMVIFANGDNRAMLFIAETMQVLLKALNIEGVSEFPKSTTTISLENIPQEEVVNFGYKNLVFSSFSPTLPDAIVDKGPLDPLRSFNKLVGASIVSVSSQRFARAINLTSEYLPKFDPALFCPMGKVMDGWETARHNEEGVDTVVFQLRKSAEVKFVAFSTAYHLGNQAEFVQLFGRKNGEEAWTKLVDCTHLEGHAEKCFTLAREFKIDQIKCEIFPDGGLSRIGLYGRELPSSVQAKFHGTSLKSTAIIPMTKKPLQIVYEPSPDEIVRNVSSLQQGEFFDALSLAYGGRLLSVTNEHYGPAAQVLSPYPPLSMFDGFESARSRKANHNEELVVELGVPCEVEKIELDFTYFVNNNPKEVAIWASSGDDWAEIVPRSYMKPFAGNTKVFHLAEKVLVQKLKLLVFPDGGVNRVRAYGRYFVVKKHSSKI